MFIRPELGGKGIGCLFQFTYCGSEIHFFLAFFFKVVRDPCQKITLLLLKSKSVRVIVPESCF